MEKIKENIEILLKNVSGENTLLCSELKSAAI